MKLSLNWLKDYVAYGLPPEQLAERLTMAGHEVKGTEIINGDSVFEIEITPNRPDCLNVIGLARETSAIVNQSLKLPKIPSLKVKGTVDITIEDKAACPRYVGSVLENVVVGPSPEWLKDRLASIGLRSINNVVDITNFCLFESGQPLHAFDRDKLIGGKIIVRRAKPGEKMITLDGVERLLNPSILVIADAKRPVAIAGLMGGAETEVTAKTKNVLLESAYFDPILIRRAGRALGLASDSSYRFERGVNLSGVNVTACRAINLMTDLAGATLTGYRDVFVKKAPTKKKVSINLETINHFLGASIPASQAKKILTQLEFKPVAKGKSLLLTPPDFRNDIKAEVDIAEELSRVVGYDRLPSSLPQIKPSSIPTSPEYHLKRQLRRILTGQGLDECISYPLVSRTAIEKSLAADDTVIAVKNPLSLDQECMRPSLLISLLTVVVLNFNRGQKDLRLFELGKIYSAKGEQEVLGMILAGSQLKDWRNPQKAAVDFYDLKGVIHKALEGVDTQAAEFASHQSSVFTAGQSADVLLGGEKIGSFGKLSKTILKNWDIKIEDLYFAQLNLEILRKKTHSLKHFKPLSGFPSITRDVSLAVKKEVSFQQIEILARRSGGSLLVGLNFLEQYLGEKIPAGQKGLVFSLIYQSNDRTLTDKEISPTHDKIVKSLVENFNATIR